MNLFTKNSGDDESPMNHVKKMIKEITGVDPEKVDGFAMAPLSSNPKDDLPAMKGFLDKGSILESNKIFLEEYLQKEKETLFLEWTKEISRHLGSNRKAIVLHKGIHLGNHLGSRSLIEEVSTRFLSSLEEELMSKGWVVERRLSRACVDPDNEGVFLFLLLHIDQ